MDYLSACHQVSKTEHHEGHEENNGLVHDLRAFRGGSFSAAEVERLASQAAQLFLSHFQTSGGYLAEAITLLCEIATLDDTALAEAGWRELFSHLVEPLSDSFDLRYCSLYDRLFAQVVTFCRRLPGAEALDSELRRFGLNSEADILRRKERLQEPPPFSAQQGEAVRKVFVPSRVTFGADVAVTSVIVAAAKEIFPRAEIVLLAQRQTGQLFAGDARVRVHPVEYDRGGHLLQRLNIWLEIVKAIDEEREGLRPEEYWAIDPDSRLTQLGVLPLIENEGQYRLFPSRGYRKEGIEALAGLARAWLEECFEAAGAPYLALHDSDIAYGRRIRQELRERGAQHIVTVNFGVGGNDRKRVGDEFEVKLISRLLAEGGTVILAKGVGSVEVGRSERLASVLREKGWRVIEIRKEETISSVNASEASSPLLVTWQGEIGAFCGLIAASDLYLGYDSAGQHFAAALGVPTIDIFVDRTYPMIAKRWRPSGPGIVKLVDAVAGAHATGPRANEGLLSQVLECYHQIRARS